MLRKQLKCLSIDPDLISEFLATNLEVCEKHIELIKETLPEKELIKRERMNAQVSRLLNVIRDTSPSGKV